MDMRLKHAVAVAKCGSFTKAAEHVKLTQSAVTRGVADLERQLGFDLFHRTPRGAILTDKGRIFADRASRLLDDERDLLRGDPDGDTFAGTLRIGVAPASLEWALGAPIAALKKRRPRLRFDVAGGSFERMAPMLRNGNVDIAIGLDEAFGEWTDLKRVPLFSMPARIFVRRGHPLLSLPAFGKSDLAEYEFVSPSDSRPFGAHIRSLYEDNGKDWRRYLHSVDSFPIVKELVASSDAIGVISESRTNSVLFRQRFELLDGVALFEPALVCCAHRPNWEVTGAARAFISAVKQCGGREL